MKKLLIIGAGGLGKMTLDIASSAYECFFVDDAFKIGEAVCGAKIVGSINDLPQLRESFTFFVVAIGNNALREKITLSCLDLGYMNISLISELAYVSKWASIGDGCIVFPFVAVQNGTKVGNGNILCSFVEVHHDSRIGDFSVFYPNTVIRTCAVVGNRVKCGSGVSIGNGVAVFDDSIIEDGTTFEPTKNYN